MCHILSCSFGALLLNLVGFLSLTQRVCASAEMVDLFSGLIGGFDLRSFDWWVRPAELRLVGQADGAVTLHLRSPRLESGPLGEGLCFALEINDAGLYCG